MKHPTRIAALAATLLAAAAMAAPLKTDSAHTSVKATFKQMGVPLDAPFKKIAANIDYDPKTPDAAKASVDIEVASIDVGDAEMNKEVAKKEWFNAAQFPKASFVSTSIKSAGAGKLNVTGKLTIKGKSADVAFPLTVKQEGKAQVFDGQLPIKRLTFAIGEGEWKDTSMVADEVLIKFHVTAGQ